MLYISEPLYQFEGVKRYNFKISVTYIALFDKDKLTVIPVSLKSVFCLRTETTLNTVDISTKNQQKICTRGDILTKLSLTSVLYTQLTHALCLEVERNKKNSCIYDKCWRQTCVRV